MSLRQSLFSRCKPPSSRWFCQTSHCASYIGSAKIDIPEGVKLTIQDKQLTWIESSRIQLRTKRQGKPFVPLTKKAMLQGPLGNATIDLADFINLSLDPTSAAVSVVDPTKKVQKFMWGTTRSLIHNAVIGVSEGHVCILKLVGTGFRASYNEVNRLISLRVGLCVPIDVSVPKQIKVSVPVPHKIVLQGIDKQQIKLFAGILRSHRPPEPYKGKGIYVDDETIRLKVKKIK